MQRIIYLLVVSVLAVGSAAGQLPSRELQLLSQREARADRLRPPERRTVEKGMVLLEKGMHRLNGVRRGNGGFHLASGYFPAGAGFSPGVGFTRRGLGTVGRLDPDQPNRIDLNVVAAYSTREYYELRSEVKYLNIAGSVLNASFRGRYFEFPEEDFFGIGEGRPEQDRTSYLLRSLEGGADLWLEPFRGIRLGGGASYLSPSVGSGRDSRHPSLEDSFAARDAPGFDVRAPDFLRTDAFVELDRRDNPDYPRDGTFLGAKFSNYHDRGLGRFDFRRWELDAQHYVRLDDGYKVLALRGNVVMTDVASADDVPFYFMPTLGGRSRLRGFREFRFRDRNSVLATAEYRWEAWWALDVALFVEGGKVAGRRADLDFSDWEAGYGVGFRFHDSKSIVVRLDLAFSREGFVPLIRAEHVF